MIPDLDTSVDALAARLPSGASVTVNKGDLADVPMALAPRFTQAVRDRRLRVLDSTCPAVYAALQAGAKGQPFAPLRGLIGSDVLRHRHDWRVIDNPFADAADPIVLLPALNADVAIFHAAQADAEGNVRVGRDRDRLLAAHAAARTLVTVEAIVPGCFFDDEASAAGVIPAALIEAIALAPGGCWPMAVDGSIDLDVVRDYQRAARSDQGFDAWLAEHLQPDPAAVV